MKIYDITPIGKPRMTRAEIVEGGEKSARTVVGKNVREMIDLVDALPLRHLEEDFLGGKPAFLCRLQGAADAQGRLIDRVGQEIDAQISIQSQTARQGDRAHAAGLVEGVAVGIVDLAEHGHRRFALGSAHQRLVAEHFALSHVHDRLKGESEGECYFLAAAVAAGAQDFFRGKQGGHGRSSCVLAMVA